jgi:hypothetical protein
MSKKYGMHPGFDEYNRNKEGFYKETFTEKKVID